MQDVDRAEPLIDQADPDGEQAADGEGWADLAARYDGLTGSEFIQLPRAERAAAVRSRQAS